MVDQFLFVLQQHWRLYRELGGLEFDLKLHAAQKNKRSTMEFKYKRRSSRTDILAVLVQKHCSVRLLSFVSQIERKIIKAFTKRNMQVRATQFRGHWFLALLISISSHFTFSSDNLWCTTKRNASYHKSAQILLPFISLCFILGDKAIRSVSMYFSS